MQANLRTYLVGGAVRDEILGLPVKDRDWVVVGATPEQMLDAGYQQVGKDFPVFLHPETHEEYALARTERKTGPGYQGFEFNASTDVTLEQDLARRDLTINAMAKDSDGELIDPYGGQRDLESGVLRHVSGAFSEDPVRILRVARFMARYGERDFRVAKATQELMQEMVASGEINALVPERIWQELKRALDECRPSCFIQALRECGALKRILPEVDALFGVPQTKAYHPEIDTGIHLLMVLDQAAKAGFDTQVRFACLLHDLGKALTSKDELPSHKGHEKAGLAPVREVCQRLRVPRDYQRLAERVCEHHLKVHMALELNPKTIVRLIGALDGWRQAHRFEQFLQACEADARGRKGLQQREYPQGDFLRACASTARSIDTRKLIAKGYEGEKLGVEIHRARITAVKEVVQARTTPKNS